MSSREEIVFVVDDDARVREAVGELLESLGWRAETFAAEHANLLRALFEHRMEDDRPFPEDILLMVMQAFALMHAPLVRLLPDRDPEEVALLARTMFSAVHGIISLGLEERMVAVPPEKLRQQLAQFVDTHLAGLGIAIDKARGEV